MEDFVVLMIFTAVLVVFIVSGRKRAARQKNRAAAEKAAPRALAYDVVMTWEGSVVLDGIEHHGTMSFTEGWEPFPPKADQPLWYKGRWYRVVSVQSSPPGHGGAGWRNQHVERIVLTHDLQKSAEFYRQSLRSQLERRHRYPLKSPDREMCIELAREDIRTLRELAKDRSSVS